MNVKLKRLLLPLLRAAAKGTTPTFRMKSAARQGLFLIGKPTAKKVQGRLRREQQRTSARQSHNQETKAIREEVFKRAARVCELCGIAPPDEMHHLEGGSGRTALQAVSNCVAACRECHQFFHNAPETYREVILEWAGRYGYRVPRRFLGPPKQVAGGAPQAPPDCDLCSGSRGRKGCPIHADPAKAGGAP